MGIKKADYHSIADYLVYEGNTEVKHEYEKGQILAMTGGSINHGMFCGNIYNGLRNGIDKDDINCTTVGSEIRIHISEANSIVYPDAMVICGDFETSEEDSEAVTNPILVVEVLSKSTESYDRGDKFYKYRQLPSLKEYILIDQEKPVVETFFKQEEGIWEISRVMGMDETLTIKSLDIKILMEELYFKVRVKEG